MYEKLEELQQVLKEHISTKNALKVPLLATQTNPSPAMTVQTRKQKTAPSGINSMRSQAWLPNYERTVGKTDHACSKA